jgi:hypothetical protein
VITAFLIITYSTSFILAVKLMKLAWRQRKQAVAVFIALVRRHPELREESDVRKAMFDLEESREELLKEVKP